MVATRIRACRSGPRVTKPHRVDVLEIWELVYEHVEAVDDCERISAKRKSVRGANTSTPTNVPE